MTDMTDMTVENGGLKVTLGLFMTMTIQDSKSLSAKFCNYTNYTLMLANKWHFVNSRILERHITLGYRLELDDAG